MIRLTNEQWERIRNHFPEDIEVLNTGGFAARLKALLDGEVEAASLLPPQVAMAEQLGLRSIIADGFVCGATHCRELQGRGVLNRSAPYRFLRCSLLIVSMTAGYVAAAS
jgi:hypothetical protein